MNGWQVRPCVLQGSGTSRSLSRSWNSSSWHDLALREAGERARHLAADFFARARPTARAIFTTSYSRQVARFAASICLSSIADEKFVVEVGWRAIQRHTRSELLLFYFTFTGLGERTIHPARQHASPDALRTSAS